MKLRLKEDSKEWRKTVMLGMIGPAVILTLLRIRRVISQPAWAGALGLIAVIICCAWARPRWFRGYYRLTTRMGFYLTQFLGRIVLGALFFAILTPFGWLLRLLGKDLLQLKPQRNAQTYWQKTKKDGSLDSMF